VATSSDEVEQNKNPVRFSVPVREDDRLSTRIVRLVVENIPLAEAFLVALSLHVVMLPVIWSVGWALPWPKPPVVTTIIEYDLENWKNGAFPPKPKKIFDINDPELNK
jgi:hypothetical protein